VIFAFLNILHHERKHIPLPQRYRDG